MEERVSGLSGPGAQQQLAENRPRVGIRKESKVYGIPSDSEGSRVWILLTDSATSQKAELEGTSVWRATCKEFLNTLI